MSARNTWEDLKKEFAENGGPGKLWRAEVKRICQFRIRKNQNLFLPAEIFGFVNWDADDLAQTVIAERLLARGQAQYIVDTVEDIEHALRLLSNEVSFTLDDRRVPNQVDNIWKNLLPKLKQVGWKPVPRTRSELPEKEQDLITEIARKVLNLKRLRNRGQTRHSPLFSGENLSNLAESIYRDSPNASPHTIQKALRTALSKISPTMSMQAVGNTQKDFEDVVGQGGLSRVDDLDAPEGLSHHAARVLEVLGVEGSEISFLIASGASQNEIAAVIGVSRPTAIKRITETMDLLLDTLKSFELGEEENMKILQEVFNILGVGITDGIVVK